MFSRVLVGIDGRQGGRDAIALGKLLAAPNAAITLVHVYGGRTMAGRAAALALPVELEASEQLLAHEQTSGRVGCGDRSAVRLLRRSRLAITSSPGVRRAI